jgi:hypothetical protein
MGRLTRYLLLYVRSGRENWPIGADVSDDARSLGGGGGEAIGLGT